MLATLRNPPFSRRFVSASSQYLSAATAPITAAPLTMACWWYITTNTNYALMGLVNVGATAGLNEFQLRHSNNPSLDARAADGTTSNSSTIATTGRLNNWNHGAAVFASSTSRTVYLNGVAGTTNTTARTPSGIDTTNIGAQIQATSTLFVNGFIALPVIWNVALTGADMIALASGVHPLDIRRENLICLWDWAGKDPATNLANPDHTSLTNTGTTMGERMFLVRPRYARRPVSSAPAAPAGNVNLLRGKLHGGLLLGGKL